MDKRLAQLERRVRLQTYLLLSMAFFLIVGWTQSSKVIEAKEFKLIDEHGNYCGSLEASGGYGQLSLLDEAKKLRILIDAKNDSASMAVAGISGRLAVGMLADGNVGKIYAKDSNDKVVFKVPPQ